MSRGKKILEQLRKLSEPSCILDDRENQQIYVDNNMFHLSQNCPTSENLSVPLPSRFINNRLDYNKVPPMCDNSNIVLGNEYESQVKTVNDSQNIIVLQNVVLNSTSFETLPTMSHIAKKTHGKNENADILTDLYSELEEHFNSDQSEYVPDTDEFSSDSYSSTQNIRISKFNKNSDSSEATVGNLDQHQLNVSITFPEKEPIISEGNATISATSERISASSDKIVSFINESENNDQTKKKKYSKIKRFPDFCYFCETSVLNFGRHLLRNHSQEMDVQKIATLKPNDITRKRLEDL
nr:uncharacterized protein LOC111510643 [Leptinotarsa decemlineata]